MIYFNHISIKNFSDGYVDDIQEQLKNLADGKLYLEQYGTDLAMMGTGDLLPEKKIEGTDLLIVGGVLNYAQAIIHRLMTVRGTLPEDPTIGIAWYNYLGSTYSNKDFILAQLRDEIMTEAFRDYRTQDVPSITSSFINPNAIEFEIVLLPINGQSVNVGFNAQRGD